MRECKVLKILSEFDSRICWNLLVPWPLTYKEITVTLKRKLLEQTIK